MTSIRAFIISSSMFLCVWLAASYTTQFEKTKPTPAARQPASAGVSTSSETEREQETEAIARVR